MHIDQHGWLEECLKIPSPNFAHRPVAGDISLVIIHAISLPPGEFGGPSITSLFTNSIDPARHRSFAELAALRVSSHLLIRRDGALVQYVSFLRQAWHAGVSRFRGRDRCNDFSIGIELEGGDFAAFSDAQYQALHEVMPCLVKHYPISDTCGHQDVAPARKTDPGPFFDWARIPPLKKSGK